MSLGLKGFTKSGQFEGFTETVELFTSLYEKLMRSQRSLITFYMSMCIYDI